ncbi:hypothetical protein [Blastococcus brunescens]|uniref:UvrB interaction domain-containing protein n=1 Tax=Blastococcus brunescens TaxID=1564165 RepID=A0ABZ1B8I8_9ACTN|nr:hypothetical protein [Blastococcus sp. BMG 8361]WRL67049.1 hypothetical protein U6N30_17810 [Blastococcus sp. BMG 8361]
MADRAGAAPHPGDGAQQDPRGAAGERVPRAAAEQRRRVLRLLLRLLPARGLRPADGHLHREGLVGQRRGRAPPALRHQQPAHPARRRGRGHRLLHLRPGHAAGVRGAGAEDQAGETRDRDDLLRTLVTEQYTRNDLSFTRGTFRVRGDTIEVFPVYEELACRIEMFGDEVERLYYLHPLTGEVVREVEELFVFPASHYVAGPDRMERAIRGIEAELEGRLAELERQGSCWRPSGCACARPTTSR